MKENLNILSACHALGVILKNHYFQGVEIDNDRFSVEVDNGRKYYKIVQVNRGQRSVHAFVDKETGDLYKAASWNAPAKGIRFNLLRDMENLSRVATWSGGYLYSR